MSENNTFKGAERGESRRENQEQSQERNERWLAWALLENKGSRRLLLLHTRTSGCEAMQL